VIREDAEEVALLLLLCHQKDQGVILPFLNYLFKYFLITYKL
jgi:hypothetical protein